jgi:beta-N-acetylhexosaminidase
VGTWAKNSSLYSATQNNLANKNKDNTGTAMSQFHGGEFIIMGIPGFGLDFEVRHTIKAVQPAGFILFARNIETPHQLRDLTDELRALVKHAPIITVDQEGGRVSRLNEFMAEPPSAKQLADHADLELIKMHGSTTGKLLRLFGFNLNLAPVLDVLADDKHENSLKGRTYGKTAAQVIANATAYIQQLQAQGVLSCGKHFPGYSFSHIDPHNDLPKINRSRTELESLEWEPFKALLPILDSLMVGHVLYPKVDNSGKPASLSPVMVQGILREEWRYEGCVITDDLDMGAVKKYFGGVKAAQLAMEAGNDLLLLCHEIDSLQEIARAISSMPEPLLAKAYTRVESLRNKLLPPLELSMEAAKELDSEIAGLHRASLANEHG